MVRLWLRLLAFVTIVAAIVAGGGRAAHADAESLASLPSDVGSLEETTAPPLRPAPADFLRIERGWLTMEFPASLRDRAIALANDADQFRAHLSAELGQSPLDSALVRIARTPEQMVELAPQGLPPASYAAGMAYPSNHLILLTQQAPQSWDATDLPEVLRHELSHLALVQAVAGHPVPRWFNEGVAIYESGELPWARRMALAQAAFGKRLLPFDLLDTAFYGDTSLVQVAYAESASVVGYLLRDADRARFGSLVARVRAGSPFERALRDSYGIDLRKLEYEWREEVARHFSVLPLITGGGLLWVIVAGLMVAAWVKRRRRARAKFAEWAREEAAMQAVLAEARSRPPEPSTSPPEDDLPPGPKPGIPVVEHEGRWYTVH